MLLKLANNLINPASKFQYHIICIKWSKPLWYYSTSANVFLMYHWLMLISCTILPILGLCASIVFTPTHYTGFNQKMWLSIVHGQLHLLARSSKCWLYTWIKAWVLSGKYKWDITWHTLVSTQYLVPSVGMNQQNWRLFTLNNDN